MVYTQSSNSNGGTELVVLPAPPKITKEHRKFLMSKRRGMILELCALEDFLLIPRSIPPRNKKRVKPFNAPIPIVKGE